MYSYFCFFLETKNSAFAAARSIYSSVCALCHCKSACVCLSQTVLYSGLFSTYQRLCEVEGRHLHSVAIVKADGGQLE